MLSDLPKHEELLLSAKRSMFFFIKSLTSTFNDDYDNCKQPPIGQTDAERVDAIMLSKESFLQTSLMILFNSAEIYLKSKIAEINVFLLLSDINQAKRNPQKETSFYDCYSIDARQLPAIYEGISGNFFSSEFHKYYEEMRIDRNRVIHLGSSKKTNTSKQLIVYFFCLHQVIFGNSINDTFVELLVEEGITKEEALDLAPTYTADFIDQLKTLFPIGESLIASFSAVSKIREWESCSTCSAVSSITEPKVFFSKNKFLCLSCGESSGV
ncbi:hypothetical protein ACED51_06820 [Photobacterium swingsii]|uniref:hypothetical protein n=1 Tax=Photobacterium swingsii TaxID=680026 RepID=UPI00352BFA6A